MSDLPPYARIVEESLDYAIFCIDTEGMIRSWNRAAEALFHVSEKEAVGQPSSIIFTPEDIATGAYTREIATASQEGRAEDDRWHVRPDGTRFWANGVLTALRDENGVVESFVKVVRDETDHRRSYESIKVTEEQYARLFFGNGAAIVVERTPSHEIVFANESFFELTGRWRAEIIGRTGADLQLWADESERSRLLAGDLEGRASGYMTLRAKGGPLVRCVVAATAIKLDSDPCLVFTYVREPLAS